MITNSRKWLHGLGSALITGGATSFMAALGITGANAVGISVNQLDAEQLGFVTLFGGLIGMAAYLKQSPLPTPEDSEPKTET